MRDAVRSSGVVSTPEEKRQGKDGGHGRTGIGTSSNGDAANSPRRLRGRSALGGGPGDRGGPREGARAPTQHPGDDRERELRAWGGPGGGGVGPDQQVRRRVPGQALL